MASARACLLFYCFAFMSLVSSAPHNLNGCSDQSSGAPLPAGTECRPFQMCDYNVNYCDGIGTVCPEPTPALEGAVCVLSRGDCELPGLCTGQIGGCMPPQLKPNGTFCREPQDVCEERSQCDGLNPTCSPVLKPSSFRCRVPRGPCEEDGYCSGNLQVSGCRDSYSPTTKICASGICGHNSTCLGNHFSCPPIQPLPNMTVCRTLDPAIPSCVAAMSFCNGVDINACPEVFKPNNTICGYAQWNSCPRPQPRVCNGISGACPAPTSCPCLPGEYGIDCSCSFLPLQVTTDSAILASCVNQTWTLSGSVLNINSSALSFDDKVIVMGSFQQDRTSTLIVSEAAFISVRQQLEVAGSLAIRIKMPQEVPNSLTWWINGSNPTLSGFSNISVESTQASCVYFRWSQNISSDRIMIYIFKHQNTSCEEQAPPDAPGSPEASAALVDPSGSNGGLITGIIIGLIIFLAIFIGVIVIIRRRRARKAQNPAALDVSRIPPVKPYAEPEPKKSSQKIFQERYSDIKDGDDEEEHAGSFSPSFYSDRPLTESFKPRETRIISISEGPVDFAPLPTKKKKKKSARRSNKEAQTATEEEGKEEERLSQRVITMGMIKPIAVDEDEDFVFDPVPGDT